MTDTGETMGLRSAVARIVEPTPDVWRTVDDWRRVLNDPGHAHAWYQDHERYRVAALTKADAILRLPQLAAPQARITELEAALEPFAKVAEHYTGDRDADLVVVDLGQCRAARAALRKGPQQ